MKKNTKFLLIFIVLAIIPISMIFNPLRWSENHIRNTLLNATPIGTSMEDVEKFIVDKQWKIVDNKRVGGFPDKNNKFIGYKSIQADLGDYGIILTTNVTVFWGFDEELKLIDIRVWKTIDSL